MFDRAIGDNRLKRVIPRTFLSLVGRGQGRVCFGKNISVVQLPHVETASAVRRDLGRRYGDADSPRPASRRVLEDAAITATDIEQPCASAAADLVEQVFSLT